MTLFSGSSDVSFDTLHDKILPMALGINLKIYMVNVLVSYCVMFVLDVSIVYNRTLLFLFISEMFAFLPS